MASSKQGPSPGILRAGHLLPSSASERTLTNARVRFSTDAILSIEEDSDPAGAVAGRTLLMSPLANAHDHGRGLRTLDYGVADTAVEAWVPATYALPPVDPYLVAAAAFARMVRSGIGSTVHCHLSNDIQSLRREARAVRNAADDVGIRVAFVVPLRDGARPGYSAVRAQSLKPAAPVEEQLALVKEIARECEGPLFQVQYGPVGLEWCSDALLEGIARESRASGRRVHMHFLESRYQREWADAAFARSPVGHLRSLGLLSERLTLAHGTWLRRDECEALASCGALVSVNTSSNLRLRSGIAPVQDMHGAGLKFAVGMDALALDDDDDMLREMRLARLLHAGRGFDEGIPRETFLDAATRIGTAACGCVHGGRIAAGMPADLLLLDLDREGRGTSLATIPNLLHARATAACTRTLVIDGRVIFDQEKVTGVDEPEIVHELMSQLNVHQGEVARFLPLLQDYQQGIATHFKEGRHVAGAT